MGNGGSRAALPALFGVVVVDLIGFGIVMPILPFYAAQFGASGTELGVILTAYAAAQFAFAPMWGRLSDRVGRRRVLLSTVAGTSLALLLLGLASSLEWMLVARLLAGAFAANLSVASAYITDVTDESERTRFMGLLGACFGVGFVLGPALGGLLAPYGHDVPMFAAAALAAGNAVFAAFVLREPERRAAAAPPTGGRIAVLRQPEVRLLCVANLLFALGVTQLESMFAYFMADRFGYDARAVAFILVGMAVVMGGVQGGAMQSLAARFAERSLVRGGCALLAASLAALAFAPTVAILLLPLAVAAVGRGVAQPALMGLASFSADAKQRGLVMGTFQSAASLARVVGPVAAGWLYDHWLGSPFVTAAALLAVVTLLSTRLPGRTPDAAATPEPTGA